MLVGNNLKSLKEFRLCTAQCAVRVEREQHFLHLLEYWRSKTQDHLMAINDLFLLADNKCHITELFAVYQIADAIRD